MLRLGTSVIDEMNIRIATMKADSVLSTILKSRKLSKYKNTRKVTTQMRKTFLLSTLLCGDEVCKVSQKMQRELETAQMCIWRRRRTKMQCQLGERIRKCWRWLASEESWWECEKKANNFSMSCHDNRENMKSVTMIERSDGTRNRGAVLKWGLNGERSELKWASGEIFLDHAL